MRLLVALVVGAVLLGGCGGGHAITESTVSDEATEFRDEMAYLFNEGLGSDASCADLFALRNALDIDTSTFYDPKLREIGCFSSTSERTDSPSAAQSEASTTSRVSQTTTTSRPASTVEFAQFLQGKLAGTSYSIDSLTSPFGKAQIQAHTYFAESICKDLRSGKNEDELRALRAREEVLGDPSLDKDISAYVDAIFEAAKTYICP